MRALIAASFAAAAVLAGGSAASAQAPAPSAPVAASPDYGQDAAWLCRPRRADACAAPLDATVLSADGRRAPERFAAARDPPVDCFYVYPTVSADPTPLSDMSPGPEEARTAVVQAARFASRCRVFAPIYRQVTMAGLTASLRSGAPADWASPYQDVRAAWRDYLRGDNHGRGVVLIGHSQGAILLARLLAEEIEANPAQHRLLVSAILPGHVGVAVPTGAEVGGDFRITPLCRRADQSGCVVAFSTYAAADAAPRRVFGRVAGAGRTAACVNPAALAGGAGPLRAYLRRPAAAPETDPPFVAVEGLSAECVTDAGGSVLRVRALPGPNAAMLQTVLGATARVPGWGLHTLDVGLTQGTLLDLVETQSRAWTARPR